ncbi:MAG TPA: YbaK/EbsC family protein [Oculatellaceae cyanobacterium]
MTFAESVSINLDEKVARALSDLKMAHRVFDCDPSLADTAAFCEHYGFSLGQSANAIVVASKNEPVKFACCIVLATTKLDVNKKVSLLLGTKKVSFANAEQTMELTGMQIGGVTPFGLPPIPIYVDAAVMQQEDVILGGGNRSTKVFMAPSELLKLPGVEVIEGLGILKS